MTELGPNPFGSRKNPLTAMLESSFGELSKNISTSIPGHIVSFDPATQLAEVQIGLKVNLATGAQVTPSVITNVPVNFWGGAGGTLETKIETGVEGLIFFSQECIDSWVEQGGVAIKPEDRRHDQNDAFFMPGFRSKPGAIKSFSNNGVRLRNEDASSYVWVKDDGAVEIDGTMLNVLCPATFMADVDTMAALRNFLISVGYLHHHGGVQSGNAISGPVVP